MRLIVGLATLLSVLCFATGVSAHASLVSAEPADGSVLAVAPKTVRLQFNENITPAVVALIDATGKTRDDVTVRTVDRTITLSLPAKLPRGTEVVSYRVISQDGHPVAGSLVFSIGAVTGAAMAKTRADARDGLIWLARLGLYLGLFAGIGGAFFNAWIVPSRAGGSVVVLALAVGLIGAVGSLGLQGLDLLDITLGDALTPAPWKAALATSLGPSLLLAVVAIVTGFAGFRSASPKIARGLSALAMVGVGVSLAASGHAATAPPQWLTRPAVFLHGVGVAYWVGALAPLAAMAATPGAALLPALNRFSAAAVPVVGVLVLTGLTLSVIQLARFGALIETNYGLILSIKLALVVGLLSLAALNRLRLTPALTRDGAAIKPLLRSILLECAVVVGILAVVAGWRFTPPPRALAAMAQPSMPQASAAQAPLAVHIHTDKAMFQVLVSPGKVGTDSFVLQLMNGDASPLAAKEVTLTLSLPERGIGPLSRLARLGADGYWHVSEVPLPLPGHWQMRIEALVTDFENITLEHELDIPVR